MPIYEYECNKCGQIEEVIQKFSDEPLTTCPHCSGGLHKLISHSAFHLKGSGWYVTDYANNKSSDTGTSPGKTEDKKPETKSGDSAAASKTSDPKHPIKM